MQNLTIHIHFTYHYGVKIQRDQGWTIHIILLLQIKKTLDKIHSLIITPILSSTQNNSKPSGSFSSLQNLTAFLTNFSCFVFDLAVNTC